MHKKLLIVFASLFIFILLASFLNPNQYEATASFHTPDEIEIFKLQLLNPIGPGEYFLTSAHCRGCHGYDSAGLANVDENGNSVNLFDHWQSTMMGNSARDPLWRAKVSHEIQVNPAHAAELQDKCLDCHAPLGRYNALFHGIPHYTLADLATDSLGADGVSCTSCHTIDSTVGLTFSGIIPYDTTRHIYGPFQTPVVGPMQLYEGYTPTYSTHMNQARVCSACHTLITQSVDTSGNFTGGVFPEQATYHEYLNSSFPANSITCQTCHMPHLDDAIIIANGQSALNPRFPFNQHVFVGGNAFMLEMIKNNKVQLGAQVEDWQFDTTIANTKALLRNSTVNFNLQLDSSANDTGYFSVRLENKAGHKFPSGYPARRAVLQLVLTDAAGDTVFKSGTFAPDFRVVGETPNYEPHHDVISQQNMPQIYEMAMGDVNYNFTSVLERAAILLKDNRIPPAGFTTNHYAYDTVKISPDALADDDFNKVSGVEGSGIDLVHYHVPLTAAVGAVTIHARLYYQSVPPKFLDEMFAFNSAEIDSFRTMFNNADQNPLLIASDSIVNIALKTPQIQNENSIKVYPTISRDGKVFVEAGNGALITGIVLYDTQGKMVSVTRNSARNSVFTVFLPASESLYFMKIETSGGFVYRKVVRK
ncbi:MAG: T9SS type A sorting domain-containing protein [Bacteroidetes bacterium]|nr:T9SS type A sorting domain-containing protein [Bacteroidota bacterium]